ncbi:hypothetical protein Tco_0590447, partial [Tanacetum coccineum]
ALNLNLIRTSESEYSVEKSESDSHLNLNKWSRNVENLSSRGNDNQVNDLKYELLGLLEMRNKKGTSSNRKLISWDNGPDVDVYCGDSVYTSHDLIAQEKKQDTVKEMTKEVKSRKNGALNKTTDDLDDFWAR